MKLLIIGSGPGLSRAVAQRFGRNGWQVVLVARDGERLAGEVAALTGDGIHARGVRGDAADLEAMDALVRSEDAADGGIELLCYNAASIRNQSLVEQPLETIATDLLAGIGGGMAAARAAIPGMAARGRGTILFTGGSLGISASHDWAVLGACKAALRNLADALDKDPACARIHVANIVISELITEAVAAEIAALYEWLHANGKAGSAWDVTFESGAGGEHR